MTNLDTERARFEAWALGYDKEPFGDGYRDKQTDAVWKGWLARAEAEGKTVSVEALERLFQRIEWPVQETAWVILREDFDALISAPPKDDGE